MKKTRLVIFVGTGGVGKTTTAASFGLALAEAGYKTVTITIDPARRLAQALGLEKLSNEAQLVKKFPSGGEFYAQWLDQKTALSELVRRTTKREDLAKKIIEHRFFEIIEGHLGGIEEYLSLEKLLSIRESGLFDFCVLDTAPSRHALDFIDSPKHLIKFFDEGILSRFVKSEDASDSKKGFWSGLLKSGQEKAFGIFRGVFGSTFFTELSELLNLSRPLHQRLLQVANGAHEWIQSSDTSVLMISAPDSKSFREIELMTIDLRARELPGPYRLLINRCLPRSPVPASFKQLSVKFYDQIQARWTAQNNLLEQIKSLSRWIPFVMTYPVVNPRKLDISELEKAGREILSQWPRVELEKIPDGEQS